ncbi:MAG: ATP-binding protein [Wenzhouxiangellaceae bacterium]
MTPASEDRDAITPDASVPSSPPDDALSVQAPTDHGAASVSVSGKAIVDTGRSQRPAPSLRARLILAGGLILLLSLGGVGLVLDRAFAAATQSALKERLENVIYLLLAVIETDLPQLGLDKILPDERLQQPGSGLYAGVRTPRLRWQSTSSFTEPEFSSGLLPPGRTELLTDWQNDGRLILMMGLEWENDDGSALPLTVWAAQHRDEYNRQMRNYRRALWPWLGVAGLIIVIAQWLGMWLGMRPLRRVEDQVKAIESGRAERLEGRYPVELKPLTDNLNALLSTERGNRERYRKALDDLAHSLKTPLAVMRESLRGAQPDGQELAAARGALDDMQQTIARQLERAVSAARRTHSQPLPIASVIDRLLTALDKVYRQRQIQCEVDIQPGSCFYGEQRDALELLGNVIENAYKYCDHRVRVSAHPLAPASRRPGLKIVVEDDGPGMSPAEFQRLQRRGERGDQRMEGQGLGLAIVAELLDAYDARFDLARSDLGGAAIHIEMPPI